MVTTLTPALAFAGDDPGGRAARQTLRWERCAPDRPAALECATVTVPLDYGDPGGRTIDLAVSRVRAGSAKERHGVLLMNPGGPGASGLTLPDDLAPRLPAEVRDRFDLIGFDPRGVGRSTPVGCGLTKDEQVVQHTYAPATFAKDVAWARTVADKCRARAGDVLPHLTTRNTARDMDVVRAALGEKRISYLGHSYGTYLGAVYLQMFPRRSDRMVLDSALDPALTWRGTLRSAAAGAERAFTRWTEWAAARHAEYGLGPTAARVRTAFWDLVAHADRTPVRTEGGVLRGDDLRSAYTQFVHLGTVTPWIAALKASAAGGAPAPDAPAQPGAAADGSRAAAETAAGAAADRAVPDDNAVAAIWAVFCGEGRDWPRDPEQYRRDAVRDRAANPLAGDIGAAVTPCAFWQSAAEEPATAVHNGGEALILQNEWDAQATLPMARGMHRALRGSRMVTVAGGEGHGVLVGPRPSCADATAVRYLTTGRLPAEDVTCGG
ncbi:alpha/beta fold hydrolase [Kitasatospora sp. NPDC057692]|uniref:alpha/beta fold hydrolase n=1 Tax=Kitasatospora sp. NPDC057692 TaxID=3346215 RepID=UPI0036925D9C